MWFRTRVFLRRALSVTSALYHVAEIEGLVSRVLIKFRRVGDDPERGSAVVLLLTDLTKMGRFFMAC